MAEKKLVILAHKYSGESTVISVRLPKDMLEDVDKVASDAGRTRNDILVTAIEYALKNMEITIRSALIKCWWSHELLRSCFHQLSTNCAILCHSLTVFHAAHYTGGMKLIRTEIEQFMFNHKPDHVVINEPFLLLVHIHQWEEHKS